MDYISPTRSSLSSSFPSLTLPSICSAQSPVAAPLESGAMPHMPLATLDSGYQVLLIMLQACNPYYALHC